jgi:hypothetical protein
MKSFWGPALVSIALVTMAAPAWAGPVQPGKNPPALGNFEQIQGDPFSDLKGLKGRVVKLVFFATW